MNFVHTPTGIVAPAVEKEPGHVAAIIKVTPEALAAMLQLPDGAYIDWADMNREFGVLYLRVRGAGWPVALGARIPEAVGVVRRREAKPEDMISMIDWNFQKVAA